VLYEIGGCSTHEASSDEVGDCSGTSQRVVASFELLVERRVLIWTE
jgi:hypothetical protein